MQDVKSNSSSEKYCINKFKNIILITLDAFNLELFLENINYLPNLKKIKDNGCFFKNSFTTGPITPFAFPGIIAGIYPYDFGIGINNNVETIADILAKNGYNTAFISEAQGFLTPFFGYGNNIQYSKNFIEFSFSKVDRKLQNIFFKKVNPNYSIKRNQLFNSIKKNIMKRYDKNNYRIFKLIKRFLVFINLYLTKNYVNYNHRKELHKIFSNEIIKFINMRFKYPQFLWIHILVNHLPYLPPNEINISEKKINYLNYRGLSGFVNYKCAQELKSLFVESLKTLDILIGKIFFNLECKKYLEDTLIILTADHGEEFMDNGYYGHQIDSSSDNLLKVPLIFYSPKIFNNKVVSVPVSTIDILPTISDLLNIKKPVTVQGISLKNLLLDNIINSDENEKFWLRTLFSESWKYNDILDRNPGYKSKKLVFTVRKGQYKLKKLLELKNDNKMIEKYQLKNWIKNEEIDIKNDIIIFKYLNNLLNKQMHIKK